MLTKNESLQFITDVLKIHDPGKHLEDNKIDFLNDVVTEIQCKIPFQGVTLVSKPLAERRRPTLAEVMSSMLGGRGGICYDFNFFTFVLLRTLGYDAYINIAQVLFQGSLDDNHLIVLVKNLVKTGDLYLVDTGCARPTFRAVDLGFEQESPVYSDSFNRYKFIKDGNRIRRVHDNLSANLVSPTLKHGTQSDEFLLFYEFEIKPTTNHEQFDAIFGAIYSNPNLTVFHRSLRAVKFPNKRLVVIVNSRLIEETESGDYVRTTFQDDKDLEAAYNKYFQEIGASEFRKAISNWRHINLHPTTASSP